MKNIAIIELQIKNHLPIILNWARICHFKGWKLTVFTKKEYVEAIEDDLKQYMSIENINIIESFNISNLFRNIKVLKKFDIVIIASL
mgnify:CR=1 FL=1